MRFVLPLLLLALASGCATYKHQASSMATVWTEGRAADAAKAFGERAQKKDGGRDAVIWHLEAGAASRAAGQYEESNRHFAAAAARIEHYEEQAKVKLAQETFAIFSNQQTLPYEGRSYDKIMLHTYRALNYLALGERDKARPELIRAYQRQQDAVEENKRRIEQAQVAARENRHHDAVERTLNDPRLTTALQGTSPSLEGFKPYADYVNPFTVYLDGLYFLYAGSGSSDLERAFKSLRRVIEVAGNNPAVQADLLTAAAAMRGESPAPAVYVIFETGRAASRDQVRIDIPIIITTVSYVGVAFPRIETHEPFARELSVRAGGTNVATTTLSSMDAIIALDFKNELPVITTKTVISAVSKAAANYAVNQAVDQQNNDALSLLVRLATAAGQAALNIADTRSWTTLPREFQVARVAPPADRSITLTVPGGASVQVPLVEGESVVVYVRSVTALGPLLINQFKLR